MKCCLKYIVFNGKMFSHRHMPNHERKFSITASLHLRVKLTWAEQSMFINMRERACCVYYSRNITTLFSKYYDFILEILRVYSRNITTLFS